MLAACYWGNLILPLYCRGPELVDQPQEGIDILSRPFRSGEKKETKRMNSSEDFAVFAMEYNTSP